MEQMIVDFLKTWWIVIVMGQLLCIVIVLCFIQLSIRRISQLMGMKNISIKLWVDNQDAINIEKNQGEK